MAHYLAQGLTLGLVIITPGPLQAYVISQTLEKGWRRTLPSCLAPLLSDGPIILLMVFLLTQAPLRLLNALQIVGGLYILWLAVRSLQAALALDLDNVPVEDAGPQTLYKATMINVLNPNPYIFWGTVGARTLLEGWRQAPVLGLGFIAGFYVMAIISLAAIIMLFGTAQSLGPRLTRILSIISSVALLGFGAYQLWVGITVAVSS